MFLKGASTFERNIYAIMTVTESKYINQVEAAKYLGMSKSTVSLMTTRGELTCYRVGRSVRYTIQDLDNFMESHRINTSNEELGRERGEHVSL